MEDMAESDVAGNNLAHFFPLFGSQVPPLAAFLILTDSTTFKKTIHSDLGKLNIFIFFSYFNDNLSLGKNYYFCAVGCKERFEKEPEKYVKETEGHSSHCC
jgi:hypothetical protein